MKFAQKFTITNTIAAFLPKRLMHLNQPGPRRRNIVGSTEPVTQQIPLDGLGQVHKPFTQKPGLGARREHAAASSVIS